MTLIFKHLPFYNNVKFRILNYGFKNKIMLYLRYFSIIAQFYLLDIDFRRVCNCSRARACPLSNITLLMDMVSVSQKCLCICVFYCNFKIVLSRVLRLLNCMELTIVNQESHYKLHFILLNVSCVV